MKKILSIIWSWIFFLVIFSVIFVGVFLVQRGVIPVTILTSGMIEKQLKTTAEKTKSNTVFLLQVADLSVQNSVILRRWQLLQNNKITGYFNNPINLNVKRWQGGRTAPSIKVRQGICAADWNILPIGSTFWIKDYGWCEVQE